MIIERVINGRFRLGSLYLIIYYSILRDSIEKEMSEFVLLIGNMGSGKTTYARSLSDHVFLSHDEELEKTKWDWPVMFNNITARLQQHPSRDFVMDGWFSIYNLNPSSLVRLRSLIPHTIRVVAFYAPLAHLQRDDRKNTKRQIRSVYEYIMRFYRHELKDFDFAFRDWGRFYSFTEFSRLVRDDIIDVKPEDVDTFKKFLEFQKHDRYYQTILLPFGQRISGRENTELVWNLLRNEFDWRGKTMVDLGSYHAYMAFGAIDVGAKYVLGIDKTVQAIRVAQRLKKIWRYQDVDFVRADLDRYNIRHHFDIALCLNTLQYFTDLALSMGKIFRAADLVIIETHEKYRGLIDSVARTTGHKFVKLFESPRWQGEKRVIYLYQVGKPNLYLKQLS
ncbi:MAG: methyltransferase domain-containing protein [Patescibacteria group bacterium]